MRCAFLQKSRHGTVFYFRRKIPLDLRTVLAYPQIYVTLETTDRAVASARARKLAVQYDEVFAFIRNMKDKSKFSDTPLGRLIEKRKTEAPLRERIEELEDALLAEKQHGLKALRERDNLHTQQSADLVRAIVGKTAQDPQVPLPVSPPRATSMSLKAAIAKLLESLPLKDKSLRRYRGALQHLQEHFGENTQVHTITQERFGEYAKLVNKHPEWSEGTKRLNITVAGRLFSWGSAGHVANMPTITTRTHKLGRSQPADRQRDAYDEMQLAAIFNDIAAVKKSKPERFWITACCAFLGCRLEEIAQADVVSDFRQTRTGVWYLDINEDIGGSGHKKSVKTLAGWRTIPIHPVLIKHGFIQFLEAQRASGARTLFERFWQPRKTSEPGRFIFNHHITRWGGIALARLKRNANLHFGKQTFFHSFRHTFSNYLSGQDVSEEKRAARLAGRPQSAWPCRW
ncbi:MAG TPA: DUF6538 domain-containing protein [Burkholderiales bacterium]|jgi:integrase